MLSAAAYNQLDEFEKQAQQLLQLSIELAAAHREAGQIFISDTNRSLGNLRTFLFGAVAVTFALAGSLAW